MSCECAWVCVRTGLLTWFATALEMCTNGPSCPMNMPAPTAVVNPTSFAARVLRDR